MIALDDPGRPAEKKHMALALKRVSRLLADLFMFFGCGSLTRTKMASW